MQQRQIPNTTFAMLVQDAKTGKVISQIRGDEFFYPASNTKLFTAAAALKFFGADFQFQTTLHATLAAMQDGIIKDDVALVFRGDPSLKSQDIFSLLSKLKESGVKEINGNFIVDDTAFSGPEYGPGWTWDSLHWYFSAPVSAIILNENMVQFQIQKADKVNAPLVIKQSFATIPLLPLKAKVRAASSEEAEKKCELSLHVKNNEINLDGCWPIDKTPTTIGIALDNPRELAKILILQDLKKLNIRFDGKVVFKAAPTMPIVASKKSPPINILLTKVLSESNNIYTEALTKVLGLSHLGKGSFQSGTQAIQAILTKESKLDFSRLHIRDGSGQSRYNLISAQQITNLLYYLYHDPCFPIFYAALSVNGKTGSLATRLNQGALVGKIVGKTGSANGSSALAGYFKGNRGNDYIFSLLINQATQNQYALKAFEDNVCLLLLEEPWTNSKPAQ
jgi:D-alanyl-D-alanine carboxypeptidase/D-alanyl-D-alanine-endopeptidase (penicillin-binding protein 4)